ncbi:DUF4185 domain-containing protein [Mycobacterium sp.]|uniref:DUF4185 domain-containing protein n=1 Tax=Mycobacterium sp. TaxID=1785 RepID=UPI0031E2F9A6
MSMGRLPNGRLGRCAMSAIPRIVSLAMASAVAAGLIAAVGPTPPAGAANCDAPEANIDPPAAPPSGPAPSPVPQPPTGRRPPGANIHAPLPRLGPLISALLHPSARYSAQIQHQEGVVPPAPNPPAVPNQQLPNVNPAVPDAAPEQALPAPTPSEQAPPVSIAGAPTSLVDWVTGPNSPNQTLQRFGISGTDLGITWDNGDPVNHQVLMAFGDTFGYCRVQGQQWRYNTLFRSQDHDLSDGVAVGPGLPFDKYSGSPVRQANFSKQVLPAIKWAPQEGMIPTAGISIGRTQYMSFMSIRQWVHDGDWTTNYSAIAMSPDNGQNWGIYPRSVRIAAPDRVPGARFVPGNEHFQMGAFMRSGDGYVYSFGSPPGRGGALYLSRVPQNSLPDLTKYQYWNGDGNGSWVPRDPGAATPILPGPVGEMSAQYNPYLKRYLMLYCNGANDVVARTAPAPQGPWSPEQPLVSSFQIPGGIYAPYIHPWSSGKDLYFTLSLWSAYDVMLMHTVMP